MSTVTCCSCDAEILGGDLQSLPFSSRRCEIVDNDFEGEWAGMPACKRCFDVHKAAGVKGLDAYLKATDSLRSDLELAQASLREIHSALTAKMDALGL